MCFGWTRAFNSFPKGLRHRNCLAINSFFCLDADISVRFVSLSDWRSRAHLDIRVSIGCQHYLELYSRLIWRIIQNSIVQKLIKSLFSNFAPYFYLLHAPSVRYEANQLVECHMLARIWRKRVQTESSWSDREGSETFVCSSSVLFAARNESVVNFT